MSLTLFLWLRVLDYEGEAGVSYPGFPTRPCPLAGFCLVWPPGVSGQLGQGARQSGCLCSHDLPPLSRVTHMQRPVPGLPQSGPQKAEPSWQGARAESQATSPPRAPGRRVCGPRPGGGTRAPSLRMGQGGEASSSSCARADRGQQGERALGEIADSGPPAAANPSAHDRGRDRAFAPKGFASLAKNVRA